MMDFDWAANHLIAITIRSEVIDRPSVQSLAIADRQPTAIIYDGIYSHSLIITPIQLYSRQNKEIDN